MKTCAAGAACLLAACLAAACGDDDDDGGGAVGGGGGKVADVMPPVTNAGIKFPVTAIYYGGDDSIPHSTFSYENGRMTSWNCDIDGDGDDLKKWTFSENPLMASGVYEEEDENGRVWVSDREVYMNIRVNGMGFMTSCLGLYDVSYNFTAEYDGEGHTVRETGRYEDEGEVYTDVAEYTWINGNLTHVSIRFPQDEYLWEWDFTYNEGRYPNPGVWSFGDLRWPSLFGKVEDDLWLYGGLLGKPTKDIPVEIMFTNDQRSGSDSHYHDVDIYLIDDVKYNGDGSVNSISYSEESGYSSYSRFAYGNASGISYKPAAGYSPVRKSVTDGSRRGRRGLLHKRLMERIAQGKAAQ